LTAAVIAAGVLAPATDAVALWGDKLELFVAESVTHDDNVFRISRNLDPAVALGSPSKADTYTTTSFGFNLDVPASRQRFQAGLTWNKTRYDRFSVLDLDDGHDGRATWLWQVGNDLGGQLGYTDTLALASLADTQGGLLTGTPNVLRTQRVFFNAAYMLTPRWRIRGETSRLKQSNDIPVLRVNDVIVDDADLAVSYVTPANNEVGLSTQLEDGNFPNPLAVAGSLVDNAYRQYRVAAVTDWTITGHSHVKARAGWVNRNYDQLLQRDFRGETFLVEHDWKPTGKLSLNTIAQRDISPLDGLYSLFVLYKGIALRPTLALSEKTKLSGALDYSIRDYFGDPGLALGTVPPRTDRVRAASLTVSYRPLLRVTLEANLRRESRSSTAAFGDYVADIVGVGARLAF